MRPQMKLYKVTCKGLQASAYGVSYAVASDPSAAYEKVRRTLDRRDIGFPSDRELKSVELIAGAADYPDCGAVLYL